MKNKYLAFLLIILCTACSSEKAGLRELKKLCEKDAGLTIYKTVEAEGFYNAYSNDGITEHLIKGNYRFYEFCDDEPSSSQGTMFPEPGCFKVSKVTRETGLCDERVNAKLATFIVDPYPEFREKNCIAVEKIERPTVRYRYEHEKIALNLGAASIGELSKGIGRIIDTQTQEVLGESINYVWYSSSKGISGFRNTSHCGSYEVTGLDRSMPIGEGFIEKVLLQAIVVPIKAGSD